MKRLILTGIVALALSACTNPSPPHSNENDAPIRDQLFGVGPINHKWTRSGEGVRYNFDMNQNPQEIRNLSEQQFSISDDQDKIRHLVKTESKFDPGAVAIVGNRAYVQIHSHQNVSNAELKELHNTLQTAMPRYDIRILIQD